jgi:hypothetical protein
VNKYLLFIIPIIWLFFICQASAQTTYFSRVGHVKVNAYSDLMDMEADNYQIAATFNPEDGSLKFQGLLKSFVFDLGLADRIISDKRINVVEKPKILFEGRVINIRQVDLDTPGEYSIKVKGNLYIWGYKRVMITTGTLVVNDDGSLSSEAQFKMKIEEESVEKVNELMRQHLPAILNVDANKLGLSRDFYVQANMDLKPIIRP